MRPQAIALVLRDMEASSVRHLNETGLTLVFKSLVDLHAHIPSAPHFFCCIYILRGSMANRLGAMRGLLVIRDQSSISLLYQRAILVIRERNTCYVIPELLFFFLQHAVRLDAGLLDAALLDAALVDAALAYGVGLDRGHK